MADPRPHPPLSSKTSASDTRKELQRVTDRLEWADDDFWNFFLRGRKEILDAIFEELPDKDWRKPAVYKAVDKAFVTRAWDKWGQPDDSWVLAGGWLAHRPDIVAWMRKAYWRHNQYTRKRKTVKEDSNHPGPPEGSAASSMDGRSWRNVVL
ncbi:hypothetical protein ACEPPN_005718 [Leptodophora sp. 'Broadleaf-Isolate-01']